MAQAGDELADELARQVQRVEVLTPHLERLLTIQVTEGVGERGGERDGGLEQDGMSGQLEQLFTIQVSEEGEGEGG